MNPPDDSPLDCSPLVAVDIGNTRIKLGLFGRRAPPRGVAPDELEKPDRVVEVAVDQLDAIDTWLRGDPKEMPSAAVEVDPLRWYIGSVQRAYCTELLDWLGRQGANQGTTLLCSHDLPLTIEVPRGDMVGIDRLLAAVAANRIRNPKRPAIIVDLGTAVTVDLISAAGAFRGGAILPGVAMSARAMHAFTDLLPLIEMSELHEPPSECGIDTVSAMHSGIFWGTIGAARELIRRMAGTEEPEVILTGGAAAHVAPLLDPDARYEPHLTLAGIAIAAHSMATRT